MIKETCPVNKELFATVWRFVLVTELKKLVKSTRSPVDDTIVEILTAGINDYLGRKPDVAKK